MKNIYIETDENFRVTKIHRMPFDPVNGMGYTREELEKKGFFVDEIPEPVHQVGRRSVAMYNPDSKTVFYEYVGIPMSDRERLDELEKATNFLLRSGNVIYGANQPAIMAISAEEDKHEIRLNEFELGAASYLTHQIISGKLDAEECLRAFPQFAEVIKETLKDNGIQV